MNSVCVCPNDPGALYTALKWSIEWHDQNEPFFRWAKDLVGDFAYRMYTGDFPDRRQTLYLCGEPGSGKSSLLNIYLNVTPLHRIFKPIYESAFPFSNWKPWHLVGNYLEFRLSNKWSPSTTLLMLERAENILVDVKNEGGMCVERGPQNIMSSNHLTPKGPRNKEDLTETLDRTMPGKWDLQLPRAAAAQFRCNALDSACKRCSVEIMRFCSSKLAEELSHN